MGVFDYVRWDAQPCPSCGKSINEWQTKDSADGILYLRDLTIDEIEVGGTFYGVCTCGDYITYVVRESALGEVYAERIFLKT